jgi:hypothetical protein
MAARREWAAIEDECMRRFYPHLTAADMADVLKRSSKAVYQRAKQLGLRKSEEFLAGDRSGRVARGKQDPRMVATQFKKGQASWCKGLKGVVGVQDACRATQFKKGRQAHEAHNYVPIGSHRVCADGYLERKVTDDPAIVPARRWVALHRLVWEAERGPIPAGHIVCFLPGKKTTVLEEVTVDRLECITRAENARRNHPRARSPELAKLVQLKGAITRQVNRIAREAQEQRA